VTGETDNKDRNESRRIAIVLISLTLVLVVAGVLMLPALAGFVDVHLSPGLGLRDAAVIAFFVTVAIMVVFAVAAGDGLLGELQFMLGGFFTFFVIIWLFIAWIF
jgi:thiosulfate reductase cytochrome b subunit